MKLFVGNLSYDTTEEDLQEAFASHGNVVSAKIITDRYTGQSKGFAFVEMESREEGSAAQEALDGTELHGRSIIVNEARPQEQRKPSSGGPRRSGPGGSGGGGGGGYRSGGDRGGNGRPRQESDRFRRR